MKPDFASILFIFVVFVIIITTTFSLYISIQSKHVFITDRLAPVAPDAAHLEHLGHASQTPVPRSTPTPALQLSLIRAWEMGSLEYDVLKPASSFPEPSPPFIKTDYFYFARNGKPFVILFTVPGCRYCDMEKQAFLNATSKFGEWHGVNGTDFSGASFESEHLSAAVIEVNRAPYPYQPLFILNSPENRVPLLIVSGVYKRIGGPSSPEGIVEESSAMVVAICAVLPTDEERPEVCAGSEKGF